MICLMSFANLCSSRWKFCDTQLPFKRTRTCQFRWQWWWNIAFFYRLLAKNCFVTCSQFLLTDHTWTGSCAFAHGVSLCVVYINADKQSTFLLDNSSNSSQDNFNHGVADHNFIVVQWQFHQFKVRAILLTFYCDHTIVGFLYPRTGATGCDNLCPV